jgi:hypothetical protein
MPVRECIDGMPGGELRTAAYTTVSRREKRGLRLHCAAMSEQAISTDPRPPEEQSSDELRAELERQRKEILRLRDLLIGKDAELGAAKGRLAELDDRSRRLAAVAERLGARVPGLGRLMGTVVRLLRSQQR